MKILNANGRGRQVGGSLVALMGLLVGGCASEGEAHPRRPAPAELAALPAVRVRVATARRAELDAPARLVGALHPFSQIQVAAEVAGKVVRRAVERGELVEEGHPLFVIDSSSSQLALQQASASLRVAAAEAAYAQRERDRGDRLAEQLVISGQQHEKLGFSEQVAGEREALAQAQRQSAAKAVRDARVSAPLAATVAQLHADVGDWVAPGRPLATLVDVSRLRLRVGLSAAEAASVPVRASVSVHFAELGGVVAEATLHDVSELPDPAAGTYTAELWLERPDGVALRPGMLGRLALPAPGGAALVVPRVAVERAGEGFGVWVVEGRGEQSVARRRAVTVGRHDQRKVQILAGLGEGERVVIDGLFSLADGDRVQVELDPTVVQPTGAG